MFHNTIIWVHSVMIRSIIRNCKDPKATGKTWTITGQVENRGTSNLDHDHNHLLFLPQRANGT
jgi:hypothetical protein